MELERRPGLELPTERADPPISVPAPSTAEPEPPKPASTRPLAYIVAATVDEERRALALSAALRDKGYPSEVHWSDSGFFVVILDRLPADEARRKRDEAVTAGDVPGDCYLIRGTSLSRKVSP